MHRNQINLRVVEDEEDHLLRLRLEALQSLEDKLLKNKVTNVNTKNDKLHTSYASNGDRMQYENWNENEKPYSVQTNKSPLSWLQEQSNSHMKEQTVYDPSTITAAKSIKNVQLSPRSLAFVSENMDILSKRKGGITPPYHHSPRYSASPSYDDKKRSPSPLLGFSNHTEKYYKKSPGNREKDLKIRKRSNSRSPYKSQSGRHYSVTKGDRGDYSPTYSSRNWPDSSLHSQNKLSQSPKRDEFNRFEKTNYQSSALRMSKSNLNNRPNNFKSNYKERNNYRKFAGSKTNGRPRGRSRSRSVNRESGAYVKKQKLINNSRNEKNSQQYSKQNQQKSAYRLHPNKSRSSSPINNSIKKETMHVSTTTSHETNNLQTKLIKDEEIKLPKQEVRISKSQEEKEEINSNFSEKVENEVVHQEEDDEENNDDEDDVCIDLFPSDDSESENEGRFKLNSKKENDSSPAPVLSFSNLGKSLPPVVKNLDEITNAEKKPNTNNSYNSPSSNINRYKSNGNHRETYNVKRMRDYDEKRRINKGGRDYNNDRNNDNKSEFKHKQIFQSNRYHDKFKQKYKDNDVDRKNRNYRDMSTEKEITRPKLPKNDSNRLGSSSSSNNKSKSSIISRKSNIHLRLGEKRDKIRKSSRDKLLDKV